MQNQDLVKMQKEESDAVKTGKEIAISTSTPYTSSVPLITLLCRSKTRSGKLFYFIVFIVSTGTCFFHMFQFISLYIRYPVLNFMSSESNLNAEFPAVTVCNLNRAKRLYQEMIKNGLDWEFEISAFEEDDGRILFTERKSYSITEEKAENNVTHNYRNEARDFFNNYTKLQEFSHTYYGYDIIDIIRNCEFNSQPCNWGTFSHFHHLQYGNCYTFNGGKLIYRQRLKSHRPGPDSGLELTLRFAMDEYLDLTPSVGIRVVIHHAEEDPDPMESGFNISPGFETNVALSRSSIRRMPPPYRDQCLEYGRNSSFPSQLECVRSCMQEVYASRCSCVEPFMKAAKNERRCDLRNTTEMSCLDAVLEDLKDNGLPCDCPIACVTNSYDFSISSSHLARSLFNLPSSPWSPKKKSTKLKVFFKNFDNTIYFQTPMFTLSEIVSHVGGLLSLLIGFSFLAIFELVEVIFTLIARHCKRKKNLQPTCCEIK